MKIRAVIFDIYRTLLEVGAPRTDAEKRWAALWLETFGSSPRFDLCGFGAACGVVVAREHAATRAVGATFPEVFWPDIVAEVLPELTRLPADSSEAFLLRHAELVHPVKLSPGAERVLRSLHEHEALLGLASNCQPHTLTELKTQLAPAKFNLDLFHPSLRFFSFEHGFSKPDPRVMQWLTARLRLLGITPSETLIVGDDLANDIDPARAEGWQTWHFAPTGTPGGGDWRELDAFLTRVTSA